MKKLKHSIFLFLLLMMAYINPLTAQIEMTTLFEDFYPAEWDLEESFANEKDQAWAGAETSDGGLLVVGSIDNSRAYISRYTFSQKEGYEEFDRRTVEVGDGWKSIRDIKPIGNDTYVIVGERNGQNGPLLNDGELPKIGIAFITDLGAGDPDIFEKSEFYIFDSSTSYRIFRNKFPTAYDRTLFSNAVPSAVVQHVSAKDGIVYSVVLENEGDFSIHVLNFTHSSTHGFKLEKISDRYQGLRFPHAIAACDDFLVVAGQGLNNSDYYPPGSSTLEQALVVASWSIVDLNFESDFENLSSHKAKMVTCAGEGVLVPGGFYPPAPSPNSGSVINSLAYFPNLGDLDLDENDNPPIYLEDEIAPFAGSNNPWPSQVSYAQAIAPISEESWILAGQSGPNDNEDMVAMIVELDNNDFTALDFSVPFYTEAFNGDDDENNADTDDYNYANYVIKLNTPPGEPRKYALFGKADWNNDHAKKGNSYVVIVSE